MRRLFPCIMPLEATRGSSFHLAVLCRQNGGVRHGIVFTFPSGVAWRDGPGRACALGPVPVRPPGSAGRSVRRGRRPPGGEPSSRVPSTTGLIRLFSVRGVAGLSRALEAIDGRVPAPAHDMSGRTSPGRYRRDAGRFRPSHQAGRRACPHRWRRARSPTGESSRQPNARRVGRRGGGGEPHRLAWCRSRRKPGNEAAGCGGRHGHAEPGHHHRTRSAYSQGDRNIRCTLTLPLPTANAVGYWRPARRQLIPITICCGSCSPAYAAAVRVRPDRTHRCSKR